ncbi:MAG TPA: hypothetical protein VEU98_03605 [Candidatus Eremiobacteraceae bacterium]|nr:hypothetical protein [Candidatus Eremiobacteraceae bacterium]
MFSAMLLTISVLALSQFAAYYWRALVMGVASQPVSGRVLEAAQINDGKLTGQHFQVFAELHDLTPDLGSAPHGLGLVKLYYHALRGLGKVAGGFSQSFAEWTERESVLCARYAAVQIDRRMQANLELAASIRSC